MSNSNQRLSPQTTSDLQSLSVFFPAYNEESNLRNTVEKAKKILDDLDLTYEIIIVNDGSTDQTGEIAEQLTKEISQVRMIHHPKNRGYGGAFKTGLYAAKYNWIAFTDADGQYDFSELSRFIEKSDQADLVIGYRQYRADGFVRRLNAKLFNLEMRFIFGLKTRDIDCGFKLIKKEVIDAIPKLESEGAMIEAELLIKTKRAGFSYLEIPVKHFARTEGKSTGANLKVIWRGAIVEPLRLWKKLKDQ